MKDKKINLDTLKVQSFVTDLEEENPKTIKGGGGFLSIFGCNSCRCSNGCGGTTSGGQNTYIIEICDNPV